MKFWRVSQMLTSIDTLQADFTSKVSDVEKKIDGIAQTATNESELKAKLHAQEIQLKELVCDTRQFSLFTR